MNGLIKAFQRSILFTGHFSFQCSLTIQNIAVVGMHKNEIIWTYNGKSTFKSLTDFFTQQVRDRLLQMLKKSLGKTMRKHCKH